MPEDSTLKPVVAYLHFQYALIPYGPGAARQTPQIYQHHEAFALLYDPGRALYSDFASAYRANIPLRDLAMDHLWMTKNVEEFSAESVSVDLRHLLSDALFANHQTARSDMASIARAAMPRLFPNASPAGIIGSLDDQRATSSHHGLALAFRHLYDHARALDEARQIDDSSSKDLPCPPKRAGL